MGTGHRTSSRFAKSNTLVPDSANQIAYKMLLLTQALHKDPTQRMLHCITIACRRSIDARHAMCRSSQYPSYPWRAGGEVGKAFDVL